MLLAVDVGNTSSVIGLFDGESLAAEWRIATRFRTTDELEVVLRGLLAARGIRPDAISAGVLSTTVRPSQARLVMRRSRAPRSGAGRSA